MSATLDRAKQSLGVIIEDYEECVQRYIDAQKSLESGRLQAINNLEALYKRLQELDEERNKLLRASGARVPTKGPDASRGYYGQKWLAVSPRPDRIKNKQLALEEENPEFKRIWREQEDVHVRIRVGHQEFKDVDVDVEYERALTRQLAAVLAECLSTAADEVLDSPECYSENEHAQLKAAVSDTRAEISRLQRYVHKMFPPYRELHQSDVRKARTSAWGIILDSPAITDVYNIRTLGNIA